jgi:hypothetical protein
MWNHLDEEEDAAVAAMWQELEAAELELASQEEMLYGLQGSTG